ncbi:hypothetical protein [Streptomyces asiaticus]|uniref:hypothetical protein n=1 Tax=Streptomyces asiaticus TaxID=114695 RepID=UPI003F664CF6
MALRHHPVEPHLRLQRRHRQRHSGLGYDADRFLEVFFAPAFFPLAFVFFAAVFFAAFFGAARCPLSNGQGEPLATSSPASFLRVAGGEIRERLWPGLESGLGLQSSTAAVRGRRPSCLRPQLFDRGPPIALSKPFGGTDFTAHQVVLKYVGSGLTGGG